MNIGVGVESAAARGTAVAMAAFIPGRTPSGINVEVTKQLLKETKPGGIGSQGSVVVQRKAAGDLEFNVRRETIGYLLFSLLGATTPTTVAGSLKKHAFTLLTGNPQFPTLTLGLAAVGTFQDYKYKNALVKSLELKYGVDDLLNAKAEFVAADEEEVSAHTLAFAATDTIFKPQDTTVKFATNVAGLGAAAAVSIKDLSIKITNNARPQQHLGSVTPTDVIAGLLEIEGEFTIDQADDTYHDLYKDGTSKAMQILTEDLSVALETTYHPKIDIILDNITIEKIEMDRPLDDIVRNKCSFTAHYDITNSKGIEIDLYNTVATYAVA